MKKGIIGGTSFFKSDVLTKGEEKRVYTVYGPCDLLVTEKIAFIPRHGSDGKKLPHAVNHHLNIAALKKLNVEGIISFGSVGSLKKELKPGTVLLADSYFSPFKLTTYRNREFQYLVPEMRHPFREKVAASLKENNIPFVDGGVYAETIGPRFETPAEVKFLQGYADVVGMTCASEATLSQEMEIPHVIICMMDNYANGVVEIPLTGDEFTKSVEENKKRVEKIFSVVATI